MTFSAPTQFDLVVAAHGDDGVPAMRRSQDPGGRPEPVAPGHHPHPHRLRGAAATRRRALRARDVESRTEHAQQVTSRLIDKGDAGDPELHRDAASVPSEYIRPNGVGRLVVLGILENKPLILKHPGQRRRASPAVRLEHRRPAATGGGHFGLSRTGPLTRDDEPQARGRELPMRTRMTNDQPMMGKP